MKTNNKSFLHLTLSLLLLVLPREVDAFGFGIFAFIGRLMCHVPLFKLVFCNECAFNNDPCLNGGTCQDQIGSYACVCAEGWTGANCGAPFETKIAVDFFGDKVALQGNTLVVGAPYDKDNGNDSGSVFVFVISGATWSEQDKITASDGAAGDRFGFSLAIHGDTIVVGSYNGIAYVFVRAGTTWTEQDKIVATDHTGRQSISVAITEDSIFIGAPGNDDDSGITYIFNWSGASWTK